MSRQTIHKTAPTRPTYHLADRLKGLAIDSLYSFTEGRRTLAAIDKHTITALLSVHPWGYSAQIGALDAAGQLQAGAEACAAHPLPAAINSRIRTFRSGPLVWHNAAARITDAGADPTPQVLFVAAGQHHYEISRALDPATLREHWNLSIDGRCAERPFAGPVGALDRIIEDYEAAT